LEVGKGPVYEGAAAVGVVKTKADALQAIVNAFPHVIDDFHGEFGVVGFAAAADEGAQDDEAAEEGDEADDAVERGLAEALEKAGWRGGGAFGRG